MSYRLECASLVFFGDEREHEATKGVEVSYVWNGPFEESLWLTLLTWLRIQIVWLTAASRDFLVILWR